MKKAILFTLLGSTALLAQASIDVYNCYGNAHELIIEGRVLTKRSFKESDKDDSWLTNSWENLGHFINDEKKNTALTLVIEKEQYHSKTDDEGYFEFNISNTKKNWTNQQAIQLFLDNESVTTSCLASILADVVQVGIISDFDDTLIVSGVTDKLNLLSNIFFKNYKQREVIEGMAQQFQMILSQNNSKQDNPLFIISGSPRQLNQNIHNFLDFHHFPARTLITKKMHGKNPDALLDQITYKEKKIEKLIALYPKVQWKLFGDNGEEDQEVYKRIAQKYPKHINTILIRQVESGEFKTILPIQIH